MRGLRLWVWVTVVARVTGAVSGQLPESGPAFEVEYRTETLRKLKGQELLAAMRRRARWRK